MTHTDACLDCRSPLVPAASPTATSGTGHAGRGLCHNCYQRHYGNGTLARFPRRRRPQMDRATMLARYREFDGQGLSNAEIARRIGVERTAIYGALRREQTCRGRGKPPLSAAELARLRRMVGVG